MVKNKIAIRFILLVLFLNALFGFNLLNIQAQEIEYYVNIEWIKIWINQDATIDLLYDLEIVCIQGTISFINVGQPNKDFTIGEVKDEKGYTLIASDVSTNDNFLVRVNLNSQISSGESARFRLLTNVGRMIWEVENNPNIVDMEFIPVWWPVQLNNLRVSIVMPKGVTTSNIKNTPDWDNAFHDPDEDDRFVLFWERKNLSPNQKFSVGVSYPKEFQEHYEVRKKGIDLITLGFIVAGIAMVCVVFFAVFKFSTRAIRQEYVPPVLRMETLGIRRGLTAVEASHLLNLSPSKIVAEIIFSLLMKKAIWIKSNEPVLQIELVDSFKEESNISLRYYEIGFLKARKENGTLDEVKLAKNLILLRDTVEAKLNGYCRQDTIEYYRKIVAKAWDQVEKAGTPELASKAYNENLLWILMDKNIRSETDRVFQNKDFTPQLDWWWYWYIFTRRRSRVGIPPQTGDKKPPAIPGADLADKIVTSIEKTSNNIVVNIEKFTNSILPKSQPKTRSRQPARRGVSCVCACASCACVCACVSCACACASGGVG